MRRRLRGARLAAGAAALISASSVCSAPAPEVPATHVAQPRTNPFAGARLYLRPDSPAQRQVEQWRRTRRADAVRLETIASAPHAVWFGDWTPEPRDDVRAVVTDAARTGTLPVLVAYDIPARDCGGHASGGASSAEAYRRWITAFAEGIGDHQAVVILEPDAIAETQCLDARALEERYELLRFAVRAIESRPGGSVYIDAGNARWLPAEEAAARLLKAGIAEAQGFALNVSNFVADSITRAYGARISQGVGGRHFIIDSGRNGRGEAPGAEWCNPAGRGLGRRPTTDTGDPLVDAYLWVKPPGESDGRCNGGPTAGEWWPEYALGLVARASDSSRARDSSEVRDSSQARGSSRIPAPVRPERAFAGPSVTRSACRDRGAMYGTRMRTIPGSAGRSRLSEAVPTRSAGSATRTTAPHTGLLPLFRSVTSSRDAPPCTRTLASSVERFFHQAATSPAVASHTLLSDASIRANRAKVGTCSRRESSCE